jgi:hypothetical protein
MLDHETFVQVRSVRDASCQNGLRTESADLGIPRPKWT